MAYEPITGQRLEELALESARAVRVEMDAAARRETAEREYREAERQRIAAETAFNEGVMELMANAADNI